MITCTARTGPRRCALCHDALDARTASCRACGAAHHLVCVRVPARCASCSRRLIVRWRPATVRPWSRAAFAFATAALSIASLIGATRAVDRRETRDASTVQVVLACSDPERVTRVELLPVPRGTDWTDREELTPREAHAPCGGCSVECIGAVRPEQEPPLRAILRATSALVRLTEKWPDWRGDHEEDLLVGVTLLRVARPWCSSGDSRWEALVRRTRSWLRRQRGPDGRFPGDARAESLAVVASGAAFSDPRALARALASMPAESWSPPRTWRDLALDPRPGTLPLRLDPTRGDVQALLRTLVATQRADGTWTRVAGELKDERPELATAVNALLLACALFEPDGTRSRGGE